MRGPKIVMVKKNEEKFWKGPGLCRESIGEERRWIKSLIRCRDSWKSYKVK